MKIHVYQNQDGLQKLGKRILLILTVVLALIAVSVRAKQPVSSQSATQDREAAKKLLLQKVRDGQSFPMSANNSEQAPLLIQSASSKEIEGVEFQQLTGGKAQASKYVLHPDVTLINTGGSEIIRLAICLESKLEDERNCLRFQKVKIAPGDQFSVTAKDWAGPRSMMLEPKFVQKDGGFVKDRRPIDLDSEAMWLPGGLGDHTVVVLSAGFEDGTKWLTKR